MMMTSCHDDDVIILPPPPLTHKRPLGAVPVPLQIDRVPHQRDVHLGLVVAPRLKVKRAELIVEREPAYVDRALGRVDSQRSVDAQARAVDQHGRVLVNFRLLL